MTTSTTHPAALVEQTASATVWQRPAEWIRRLGGGWPRRVGRPAEQWLGHPVHPLLTDLPIGFWTSAWILDLIGGRRRALAAQRLVGLGVLSAVPTVVTGLADASGLSESRRRVAAVHATFNAAATTVYALSWFARRHGHRVRGVLFGMAGASLATVGGMIGGQLAFGTDSDIDGVESFDDLSDELIDVELGRRPGVRGL